MATERQARRALDLFENELARRPNVVGLGIVPQTEGGPSKDGMAIGVYVEKKVPKNRLKGNDLIPEAVDLPGPSSRAVRVPTRVIEQGEVRLETPGG